MVNGWSINRSGTVSFIQKSAGTESGTEFLQFGRDFGKYGNQKHNVIGDLRSTNHVRDVEVASSNLVAPILCIFRRNHALDYLPMVGTAARNSSQNPVVYRI